MKTNHILTAALCAVSVFALAVSAYGIRTRSVAINGWQAWASVEADRQRLITEHQAAVAIAAARVEADRQRLKADNEFGRLTVLRDAGLSVSSSIDPHQANKAVRDFVYRTNRVGVGTFAFQRGDQRYAMLGQETGAQLCGGMSIAHAWAMNQIGIPARIVQLGGADFLAGKDYYQTHVTVEVEIDGKWQISDPTFNVSVDCSHGNSNLSVPEAAACVRAGGKLIGVPGKTQILGQGRTIAEYPEPYETFFAAYERGPVDIANVKAVKDEYPEPNWVAKSLQLYPKTAKSVVARQ